MSLYRATMYNQKNMPDCVKQSAEEGEVAIIWATTIPYRTTYEALVNEISITDNRKKFRKLEKFLLATLDMYNFVAYSGTAFRTVEGTSPLMFNVVRIMLRYADIGVSKFNFLLPVME